MFLPEQLFQTETFLIGTKSNLVVNFIFKALDTFYTVCYEMHMVYRQIIQKQNIMIYTNLPRNCVVFLLLCELTRSAIYGSQQFDSHKWPTVLVDDVKGKPRNFEAYLCRSLYYTFKTSFQPCTFHIKRLQALVRSKATCSFKQLKIQFTQFLKPLDFQNIQMSSHYHFLFKTFSNPFVYVMLCELLS